MGAGASKARKLQQAEQEAKLDTLESENEQRAETIGNLNNENAQLLEERQKLEEETKKLILTDAKTREGIVERDRMIDQLEAVAKRLGKNLEHASTIIADLQMKNARVMKHLTVKQMQGLMKERRVLMAPSVEALQQAEQQAQLLISRNAEQAKENVAAQEKIIELEKTVAELKRSQKTEAHDKEELQYQNQSLKQTQRSLLREREALNLQVEILKDDCDVMAILKDRIAELKQIAFRQHQQLQAQDKRLNSSKETGEFRSVAVKMKGEGFGETRAPEFVSVGQLKRHLSMELAKANGWKTPIFGT